jgi:UDPglucose--hexose-1-phosphate uridylyltransferase
MIIHGDALMIERPYRRFNPLLREWVLVSPQRLSRPWQGRTEAPAVEDRPTYDPNCYLCPGNERVGGPRNPDYENTFVFDNDFAALSCASADRPIGSSDRIASSLLREEAESGICRVVCFSPRHDLSLPHLSIEELRRVMDVWVAEYQELGTRADIGYVQIFENRGAAMGASNPHPHGQIWATASVPDIPLREQASQAAHFETTGRCLLCDYVATELDEDERIVASNDAAVAMVPFWAVWPFELLVVLRRHVTGLDGLTKDERTAVAAILQAVTMRYDALFDSACPYSMGFHQRPTDGLPHDECHLHAHFFPPVLRSAAVHKFMVGFELLANPQRDLTAEAAAARLREATVPASTARR